MAGPDSVLARIAAVRQGAQGRWIVANQPPEDLGPAPDSGSVDPRLPADPCGRVPQRLALTTKKA
jgi:hypothetical protein